MKRRKIVPNQDFKHEEKTFKKGQQYEVSPDDAKYFIAAGWVGDETKADEQSLDIQDGAHGLESENN